MGCKKRKGEKPRLKSDTLIGPGPSACGGGKARPADPVPSSEPATAASPGIFATRFGDRRPRVEASAPGFSVSWPCGGARRPPGRPVRPRGSPRDAMAADARRRPWRRRTPRPSGSAGRRPSNGVPGRPRRCRSGRGGALPGRYGRSPETLASRAALPCASGARSPVPFVAAASAGSPGTAPPGCRGGISRMRAHGVVTALAPTDDMEDFVREVPPARSPAVGQAAERVERFGVRQPADRLRGTGRQHRAFEIGGLPPTGDGGIGIGTIPSHPGAFVRTGAIGEFGSSVAGAARIPGARRATLSDLVNGQASPSPGTALRAGKAFGVSVDLTVADAGTRRVADAGARRISASARDCPGAAACRACTSSAAVRQLRQSAEP